MKTSEQSLRCNGSGPVRRSEKLLKDQGKSENLTSRVFWFSGQFQDVFRDQVKDKNPYKSFSILGFAPPWSEGFQRFRGGRHPPHPYRAATVRPEKFAF